MSAIREVFILSPNLSLTSRPKENKPAERLKEILKEKANPRPKNSQPEG